MTSKVFYATDHIDCCPSPFSPRNNSASLGHHAPTAGHPQIGLGSTLAAPPTTARAHDPGDHTANVLSEKLASFQTYAKAIVENDKVRVANKAFDQCLDRATTLPVIESMDKAMTQCCSLSNQRISFADNSMGPTMQPIPSDEETVPGGERMGFFFSVDSLNFLLLASVPALWDRLEESLLEFIRTEPDGFGTSGATVEAMGSATATQFMIFLSPMVTHQERTEVRRRLKWAGWFKSRIAKRLMDLKGMALAVAPGLTVTEVSPLVAESIVRFQGSWVKDQATYHISGSRLRFPSGGSARIAPLQNDWGFSITHSSGVTFTAVLDQMGQTLTWSNGSLWHRVQDYGTEEREHPETEAIAGPEHVALDFVGGLEPVHERIDPDHRLDMHATEVTPDFWAMSAQQCREFNDRATLAKEMTQRTRLHDFVEKSVLSRSKGANLPLGLLCNMKRPRQAETLVIHSGENPAAELLDIVSRSAGHHDENIFLDVLCLPFKESSNPLSAESLQHARSSGEAMLASEKALTVVQARYFRLKKATRFWSALAILPPFLLLLGIISFYWHIIGWGCVPAFDFSRCGIRVPVTDLSWSSNFVWQFSSDWETERKSYPSWLRTVQSFFWLLALVLFVLGFILLLAVIWYRLQKSRVVVVLPDKRLQNEVHHGEDLGLAQFRLSRRSVELINLAASLGVPVEVARGALVSPEFTRMPAKPKAKKGNAQAHGPGFEGVSVGAASSMQAEVGDIVPERDHPRLEQEAAARVLAKAANAQRWKQVGIAFLWSLLICVWRQADISLSLAGTWEWKDSCLCTAGMVVAVFISTMTMFRVAQGCGGHVPAAVAWGIPCVLVIFGLLVIALLAHLDFLLIPGDNAKWYGFFDLLIDEVARFTAAGDKCNEHRRRSIAFWSTFSETLVFIGASTLALLLTSCIMSRGVRRVPIWAWFVLIHLIMSILAIVLTLVRGVVAADDINGSYNVTEADECWTVLIYMMTQAWARFGCVWLAILHCTCAYGLQVRRSVQAPQAKNGAQQKPKATTKADHHEATQPLSGHSSQPSPPQKSIDSSPREKVGAYHQDGTTIIGVIDQE